MQQVEPKFPPNPSLLKTVSVAGPGGPNVAAWHESSYLALYRSGELMERAARLYRLLGECTVCPRRCFVDRLKDETGFCGSGHLPVVSAYVPHFGEEPPLSGTRGAGNIFFGNCNLRCVYCQNHEISQSPHREQAWTTDIDSLAAIMVELQASGCHNLNLVSPTHFVPQIVQALVRAVECGFQLPIVYNTNAYDAPETLRQLEGIIDVYLPDLKYGNESSGASYSQVDDYVRQARRAIKEMYRQMGASLCYDDREILLRGLIVRLLVLPNGIAGIPESLQFIHDELSPAVAVSLMAQYYPAHRVGVGGRYPLLRRKILESEWGGALWELERLKMEKGWVQDWEQAADSYQPDFQDRANPFSRSAGDPV